MYSNANSADIGANHNPWNKGRLIGPKPPLKLRDLGDSDSTATGQARQRPCPFQPLHRQQASGL